MGCSTTLSAKSASKIHIPDTLEYPEYVNLKKGFYQCGSNLYICITFEDYETHLNNIKNLSNTHKGLVTIIKDHNHDEEIQENIIADDIHCGFFDFKCKKKKNRMNGQ